MKKDAYKPEPTLTIKVLSPTQTYYNGTAVSVSAINRVGPFDILAGHANFFSLLTKCDVVINSGFQTFSFPITKGILKVTNNAATLFVDIEPAYLPEASYQPSV